VLWDGHINVVWDEARRLGCSRATWLQLALRSEETSPDSLAVYRQEIEALPQVTDKRLYAQVVDLLGGSARSCPGSAGRQSSRRTPPRFGPPMLAGSQ
jgi:hypothetical protein